MRRKSIERDNANLYASVSPFRAVSPDSEVGTKAHNSKKQNLGERGEGGLFACAE
jgi:hypothetical protein